MKDACSLIPVLVLPLIWFPTGCGGVEEVSKCEGVDCSGHGRCALQVGEPVCVCDDGFEPQGLECVGPDLLQTGDPCEQDAECASGICLVKWTEEDHEKRCQDGELGSPCRSDDDCTQGVCADEARGDLFLEGACTALADTCVEDADCAGDFCLRRAEAARGKCSQGSDQAFCIEDGDCISGLCVMAAGYFDGPHTQCTTGGLEEPCETDADCLEGTCEHFSYDGGVGLACTETCMADTDCDSGMCLQAGPEWEGTCTDGVYGDTCWDEADCLSAICAWDRCTDGDPGDACDGDEDCVAGTCISIVTAAGVNALCTRGQAGDPCNLDEHCLTGVCGADKICP